MLVVVAASWGDDEPDQVSWTGASEATELGRSMTASEENLIIEDVPFASGSMYCIRVETPPQTGLPPRACTKVFWSPESVRPPGGMVTFLNAAALDEERALFIGVVTSADVEARLTCGATDAESTEVTTAAGARFALVHGVVTTVDCPYQLGFDFTRNGKTQRVGTAA